MRTDEFHIQLGMIDMTNFERRSPWREVGPVFVHGTACGGYEPGDGLPPELRTGPRVLKTYGHDGALDYRHITVVPDGADIAPAVEQLLAIPDVATIHVRALAAQCFTYAVTR